MTGYVKGLTYLRPRGSVLKMVKIVIIFLHFIFFHHLSTPYGIPYGVIYVYCVYYYHNDSDFFSVYCVLSLCILLCVPFVCMYGLFVLIVVLGIAVNVCLLHSCNCLRLSH